MTRINIANAATPTIMGMIMITGLIVEAWDDDGDCDGEAEGESVVDEDGVVASDVVEAGILKEGALLPDVRDSKEECLLPIFLSFLFLVFFLGKIGSRETCTICILLGLAG